MNMRVSACFPVSAGSLVLLTGLCAVAHGGLCGTWASAGDSLWLVRTCNGYAMNDHIHIPSYDWLLLLFVTDTDFDPQHAVDPEPGTRSHRHGSRSHPRHQRIPVFGSVFLRLHLLSVFFMSVCACFHLLLDTSEWHYQWFSTFFLPLFLAVALMAVVTLYFVDYLRGKRALNSQLHFSHYSLLFLSILSFYFFPFSPVTCLHFTLSLISTPLSLPLDKLTS